MMLWKRLRLTVIILDLRQTLGQAVIRRTAIAVNEGLPLLLHLLIVFLLLVERFRNICEALVKIWQPNMPGDNPAALLLRT